jgi:phosphotriesterase-related protein
MSQLMTVTGPVAPEALGRVLVHEHIFISFPGDELDPNSTWTREGCISTAVERMQQLQEFGVGTFVDPCPIELGRDPELMAEVARQSGMNIVCSTGFYHEHVGIPIYWRMRTAEDVAELYLHEIEHGIGTTGIRPGVIKVAIGDPPGEQDLKVIKGAAIAAAESGLPVITHCENSRGGDVIQDLLSAEGADLARCLIGHQDQETDVSNLETIAKRGSFVGIDRIGITMLAPEEQRVELISKLLAEGYQDQLCLSQDHQCSVRAAKIGPPEMPTFDPPVEVQMYLRPHTYIFTDFLPRLTDSGVTNEVINGLFTANPRRLLTQK